MKKLKFILLILIAFILVGCGVKTDVFQTYEWDKESQEYTTDGIALKKDMKFNISDKEISFKIDREYGMKVLLKTDTVDASIDQEVVIYDCIMDGNSFRVVHYPDVPLVIVYEMLEDGIFQSFIIFGRDG